MLLVSKYSCTFSTPRNKKNEKGYCLDSIHLVQHNVRMLILATNMFRNELLNLAVRYQYVILHIIAKVVLNQGNKLKSSCVLLSRIETCIDHVRKLGSISVPRVSTLRLAMPLTSTEEMNVPCSGTSPV